MTPTAEADGAAGARAAVDGISQAAGVAAQRAGEAAQRAGEVLTDVAGDVASTVSAHAPAVLDASKATAGVAAREVRAASSDDLMLGSVFSTGLALGLLLARAPRVLVLLALVPVFVLGGTLLSRKGGGPSTPSKPAATKPAAAGRTKANAGDRPRGGATAIDRPGRSCHAAHRSISLLEVVEAVEGDPRRRVCVLRSSPCLWDGPCDVHWVFAAAQDALLAELGEPPSRIWPRAPTPAAPTVTRPTRRRRPERVPSIVHESHAAAAGPVRGHRRGPPGGHRPVRPRTPRQSVADQGPRISPR